MSWLISDSNFYSLINALHQTQIQQKTAALRLSTNSRINSAADDPAGLIAISLLGSELSSVQAASDNATRANDMLNTADAGASEISSLVGSIQALTLSLANDTGLSQDEKQAKQLEIDSAIASIDRLVGTTTFNGKQLLNGTYDIAVTGVDSSKLKDVTLTSDPATTSATLTVKITSAAQQGQLSFTGAGLAGDNSVTLKVTGNLGSVQVSMAASASIAQMASSINVNSATTGIHAVASGGKLYFQSQHYGSDEFVRVEALSGTFSLDGGTSLDYGKDAAVTVNGQNATVHNGQVTFNVSGLAGSMTISESYAKTVNSLTAFTVVGGGATFALSPNVNDLANIGIGDLSSTKLGNGILGYLNDIKSGGKYSAVDHAGTASRIADAAVNQVAKARANIGAFQKYTIGGMQNMLAGTRSALSDSIGAIKDTDYAVEVANLTRLNTLYQAQLSAMAMMGQNASNMIGLISSAFN